MSYRNSSSITAAAPRRSLRQVLVPILAFLMAGIMTIMGGKSITAAPKAQSEPAKSLIYCGWYGSPTPTPSFIAANAAFLDSQPFNGMAVYMRNPSMSINASTGIMKTTPMSYDQISSVLAPLAGANLQNMKDNFALVFGSAPPDFFDSWSVTIQNFSNLAAAARDAGLRGVIMDNEQYFSNWGNYPEGVDYPGHTLAEYQVQAALRGRQVMEAMRAQFPDIDVLTLHGPYISEPDAPTSLNFPQWQSANELLGPFFAGMQEGAGPGQNIDGGELYDLRSVQDFEDSYNWRRHDMPSSGVDCKFLNSSVRSTWADSVSISFGIYDRPFQGQGMTPAILQTTLTNALKRADRYVWFYSEAYTYSLPSGQGGAPSAWVDAIRNALPAGEEASGPVFPRAGSVGGSSGGSGGGRCGLLGMEVVPVFLALMLARAKRRKSN